MRSLPTLALAALALPGLSACFEAGQPEPPEHETALAGPPLERWYHQGSDRKSDFYKEHPELLRGR